MPANRLSPLLRRESLGDPFVLLTFAHPEVAREARPGQFVMLKAGESVEPPLRRPISIMAADEASGTFTVFMKAIGPGTRALATLREGDLAQCLGPLGHPFTPPESAATAAFVGGGYGVAPFLFFSRQLLRSGGVARLFYGGRTAADLVLLRHFDGVVEVETATEDGSHGAKGYVTRPLEAWLEGARTSVRLYACGPEAMMHAVAGIGARRGLVTELSLDPFMGCGVGTCLACVVRTQREGEERWKYRCACTDGPVFDASEVVWPGEERSAATGGAR